MFRWFVVRKVIWETEFEISYDFHNITDFTVSNPLKDFKCFTKATGT